MIELFNMFKTTVWDVIPIFILMFFFQYLVVKKKIHHMKETILGIIFTIVGLTLFMYGLQITVFDFGIDLSKNMITYGIANKSSWDDYWLLYIFSIFLGYTTTICEPSLITICQKVEIVSREKFNAIVLRHVVAIGVALGLLIGTLRVVLDHSLTLYLSIAYAIVIIQTKYAPRDIIPVAFDSGAVTTSIISSIMIMAYGMGLSSIPGRDPLFDAFGLIAFCSVFPIFSVSAYAQIVNYIEKLKYREGEQS